MLIMQVTLIEEFVTRTNDNVEFINGAFLDLLQARATCLVFPVEYHSHSIRTWHDVAPPFT